MTNKIIAAAFLGISIVALGCASGQQAQYGRNGLLQPDTLRMMKMDDVIALSKTGVSDSLIIATMDATNSWFKLKAQDVIDLKNAGVSERVIDAMLQQPSEQPNQSGDLHGTKYYVYSWDPWYGGFYPYWYYPSFSVGFGYRSYHPMFFHHRRFR